MVQNRNDQPIHEDRLDSWVKNQRVAPPPADLLGRCLSSIPADGSLNHVANWLRGEPVSVAERTVGTHPARHTTAPHSAPWQRWMVPVASAASLLVLAGLGWSLSGGSPAAPVAVVPAQPAVVAVQPAQNTVAQNTVTTHNAPARQTQVVVVERPAPQVAVQPISPAPVKLAPPTERIPAQLAAGEFAPALVAVRQIEKLELRDQYLAQIAVAQAQAGELAGAVETIAQISSDASRTQALDAVGAAPLGLAGGGPLIDFDSLIDLVTQTVERNTWVDAGGEGTIRRFPQGVYVDAQGVLTRQLRQDTRGWLEAVRTQEQSANSSANANVRQKSHLRKVSLTRLEKELQLRQAQGLPVTQDMAALAGLQRIQYVFVYPQTGDLVIAGPAGDWKDDAEGRLVSTDNGRPVVLLDDLVAMLRLAQQHPGEVFGCSIDPRAENLAQAQEFLATSGQRSLKPGERAAWLEDLREKVGQQDIHMLGPIDPKSHVARVLVEADYRMKLVGIGLEEGVPEVPSFLEMVSLKPGEKAPDLGLIRLWFTLNYQDVQSTADLTGFQLRGQGVQVNSEDVILAAQGQKVHTGKSSALNQAFAHNFTQHFDAMAAKYPVYAELQNVFDLALVSSLVHVGNLSQQVSWNQTVFGSDGSFTTAINPAPSVVDSVINHKVFHGKTIVTQVSGGVSANPWSYVRREALKTDDKGLLGSSHDRSAPVNVPNTAWWWD